MLMVLAVLWIAVHPNAKRTYSENRSGTLPADLFTGNVCEDLVRCGVSLEAEENETLTIRSSAEKWRKHLNPAKYQSKALALALVRSRCSVNSLTVLDGQGRGSFDFWRRSRWNNASFINLEFLGVEPLAEPTVVRASTLNSRVGNTFMSLTEASSQHVFGTGGFEHGDLQQVLNDWALQYNNGVELHRPFEALLLPVPHALLCATGIWTSYTLPVPTGRNMHLGRNLYNSVARLWETFPLEAYGVSEAPPMDASSYQRIADLLRTVLDTVPKNQLGDAVHDSAVAEIEWLQETRDGLMGLGAKTSRSMYSAEHLLKALLFSGYLKNFETFLPALCRAIDVACPTKALADYLKHEVKKNPQQKTASRSTLRRHMLSVHMGFAMYQQKRTSSMLHSLGGLTQWGTVDASPHGAYDWVLHGFTGPTNFGSISSSINEVSRDSEILRGER